MSGTTRELTKRFFRKRTAYISRTGEVQSQVKCFIAYIQVQTKCNNWIDSLRQYTVIRIQLSISIRIYIT